MTGASATFAQHSELRVVFIVTPAPLLPVGLVDDEVDEAEMVIPSPAGPAILAKSRMRVKDAPGMAVTFSSGLPLMAAIKASRTCAFVSLATAV